MKKSNKNKFDTDLLIIGAGVIGLAISYFFSQKGIKTILIDKERNFGSINSSRNTETIHAGIYYKENSLKHLLCIRGKELLYRFCDKYKIRFNKCGKIFIAQTIKDLEKINKIKKQANKNGLLDLKELDKNQIKKMEPLLKTSGGLFSPSTGIFDSYEFMQTLMNLCIENDIIYSNYCEAKSAELYYDGWEVNITNLREKNNFKIKARSVINSMGLNSINFFKNMYPKIKTPILNPIKGAYLKYIGKSPFKHIIYPAIDPGKIEERIDAAPTIFGELRFGPSVEETKNIDDFSVDKKLIKKFSYNIKKYFPKLDEKKLILDQAGIRPKIFEKNKEVSDFKFIWAPEGNWLNLWGIESPGLTSSLAIGEYVYEKFKKKGII